MGFQIQDGTGTGNLVGVCERNRLQTASVSTPGFLQSNHGEGKAYVWNFPAYDPTAGDTVMFIRNDSTIPLHIHHVYIYSDTISNATLHVISNGAATPLGTDVTGVNLNATSGNVAEVTAIENETANTDQGTVLHDEYIAANSPLTMLKEDGYEIVLGKNDCIAVDLDANAGSVYGHIVGYFHDQC